MRDLLDKLELKERWQLFGTAVGIIGLIACVAFGWGRSAGLREVQQTTKSPVLMAQGTNHDLIDLSGDVVAENVHENSTSNELSNEIRVHVSGMVKSPGVYAMKSGQRIQDAIDAAGGPVKEADLDVLNLAERVKDTQKIHVPKKGEAVALAPLTIDQPPSLPSGSYELSPTLSPSRSTPPSAPAASSGSGRPARSSREADSLTSGQIDINRSSARDLERLPGVGPAIAQRIIDFRSQNGPFRTVDDLILVKGIGPKRMEEIRPYIRVR